MHDKLRIPFLLSFTCLVLYFNYLLITLSVPYESLLINVYLILKPLYSISRNLFFISYFSYSIFIGYRKEYDKCVLSLFLLPSSFLIFSTLCIPKRLTNPLIKTKVRTLSTSSTTIIKSTWIWIRKIKPSTTITYVTSIMSSFYILPITLKFSKLYSLRILDPSHKNVPYPLPSSHKQSIKYTVYTTPTSLIILYVPYKIAIITSLSLSQRTYITKASLNVLWPKRYLRMSLLTKKIIGLHSGISLCP